MQSIHAADTMRTTVGMFQVGNGIGMEPHFNWNGFVPEAQTVYCNLLWMMRPTTVPAKGM
eukprot:scaffold753_cov34-Attheya_sp.AAC.4